MDKQFTIERNQRGELEAESDFPMSAPGRVMRINTSKGSRGLRSSVYCGILYRSAGSTSGFIGLKMCMFGEYSKDFPAPGKRATEKAIRELHASVLEKAEELIAEAEAFYAAGGKPRIGFATLEKGELAVYEAPAAPAAKDNAPINGAAVGMLF